RRQPDRGAVVAVHLRRRDVQLGPDSKGQPACRRAIRNDLESNARLRAQPRQRRPLQERGRSAVRTDRGIALITTLLVLMLMSALLVGFTTIVMSDQRYRFIDHDRNQAFYGASGGVEKLTVDLGNLFLDNVAPTNAQVTALTDTAHKPTITGVTFTNPNAPTALPASLLTPYHCSAGGKTIPTVGSSGYTIMFCANASGTPTTTDDPTTIKTGPYEGLVALQTPYQLDVTAKTATGGEVHLSRTLEAVAIPVFQFGMFSDQDLSFFAAEN